MRNKDKGFSLVELVVVIAIMVVLIGMIVPALIGYSENTRADRDTAQMQEVVTAIEMAMTNENIYDDLLLYAVENNFSCYADGDPTTNLAVNRIEDFNMPGNAEGVVGAEDLWSYGDDARQLAKTQYTPSGKMCGLTITFVHNYDTNTKDFDIGNALINNMSPTHKKSNTIKLKDLATDGNPYLYEYLKDVVSENITTSSNKYKNSEYTIFIRMIPAGVDYSKYENLTIDVYGQWGGSHLGTGTRRDIADEVDGIDAITPGTHGVTPVAPVPVGPSGIGATPQEPKAVATYVPPVGKDNLEYNEYAQELLIPGSSTEGTMYYKVRGESEWSIKVPRRTEAGTYDVYYYVKGDTEHYNTQEYAISVTIKKATPAYTVPTGKTNLFANGMSQELVTAGQVAKGGKMMYKLSTTGYSEAVPVGKAPGTYTVLWKIQETDNYLEWPETAITVTIGKMDPELQAPIPNTLTYNGTRQELVSPAVINSTAMSDNLPVIEYSLDGNAWSQSIPTGLLAGTYDVWYRVNENTYYEGTSGEDKVSVTIAKASPEITIQWNDKVKYSAGVEQVFVDAVQQLGNMTPYFRIYALGQDPSSLLFGKDYPSAIAAGTYIVEWYLPEGDNHVGNGSYESPNAHTVEIEKAIASDVNKIVVTGDTWTYDKNAHSVDVAYADGWTLSFTDSDGNTSSTIPSATNAGTYIYSWTATHDAFETETGMVSLVCNKAPVYITATPNSVPAIGTATKTTYVTSAGAIVRIEYSTPGMQLGTTVDAGECTEGGTFNYLDDTSFSGFFASAAGSLTRLATCRWECVPISDNYYIEGVSAGTVTMRLIFTVKPNPNVTVD